MKQDQVSNRKVVVFYLNDEEYAVPVEQVGLIERMQSITRVPQVEDFVLGVINLRGIVTPVIDLKARFGLEKIKITNATRIIIAYVDEIEVGLLVDQANDVIDIPESAIEPPPEVVGAVNVNYIDGVAKVEDRLLIILNLQKVLSNEEVDELKRMEG